jgi:hypothetical protein|tara:strand:- start:4616 stop:4870 length:255 start_codon:yes stop_codon:yes gene_type:complete
MAWKEVTVKNGKDKIDAFLKGDQLNLPNKLGKDQQQVTVDGKTYKVLSQVIDTRDDVITYTLELAGASPKEKGEANAESNEGGI